MHCNSLHFLSQVATISVSESESVSVSSTVSSTISIVGISGPLALGGKVVGGSGELGGGVRGSHGTVGVGNEGRGSIGIGVATVSVSQTGISQPWLGISITLAQTVDGLRTVDAEGGGGIGDSGGNGREGIGTGISKAVSTVDTTKTIAVAQPGVGLGLSLGVALPQVSGQGKAITAIEAMGGVGGGLDGQVVSGGSLDGEGSVWHLGAVGEGHQLSGGGVGRKVTGEDGRDGSGVQTISQPWLGLGSSRGGGDESSSSKSLHG